MPKPMTKPPRFVQFHPKYCDEAKRLLDEKGFDAATWDTSHDLSMIDQDGKRHKVGTFQHANLADLVGKLLEAHFRNLPPHI